MFIRRAHDTAPTEWIDFVALALGSFEDCFRSEVAAAGTSALRWRRQGHLSIAIQVRLVDCVLEPRLRTQVTRRTCHEEEKLQQKKTRRSNGTSGPDRLSTTEKNHSGSGSCGRERTEVPGGR